MALEDKQYNLFKYIEYDRIAKTFSENLGYYNNNSNWVRYLESIKSISKSFDESTIQKHLLRQSHELLYRDINKLSPMEAIQFIQNELDNTNSF
jgi:hypothetical protein